MSAANRQSRAEWGLVEKVEDVEWGLVAGCAVSGSAGIATAIGEGVTQAAFTVPAAGMAFESLRRLYDGGHPATEMSFSLCYEEIAVVKRGEHLSTGGPAPFWLSRSGESVAAQLWGDGGFWADPRGIKYLSGKMAESLRMASARGALSALLHESRDWQSSSEEFLTEALRRLMGCGNKAAGGDIVTMQEVLPRVWDRLVEEYQQPAGVLRGMDTGYLGLNRVTYGLRPGQLSLIAAETGVGKSMLAGSVAVKMAGFGRRVLVFSLEMDTEELVERYLFAQAKVHLGSFVTRKLSKPEQERLNAARERLAEIPMGFNARPGLTVEQIVGQAQMYAAAGGLDLLLVDYAQLVEGKGGGKDANREREVAHVANSLKTCARSLGCHAMVMSQLNDDGKIRESRALEHAADFYFRLRDASGEAETAAALGEDGNGDEVEMKRLICKVNKARGTDGKGREISFLQVPGTTAMIEERLKDDSN